MPRIASLLAVGMIVGSLIPSATCSEVFGDEPLPEDAARLVAAFEEDADAIRKEAEAKIARQRRELAAKLKELQDAYCRAAKLDEAVAIRDKIRLLGEGDVRTAADPGTLTNFAVQVGARMHFRITGHLTGHGYGTDVYTTDSTLATMAVHAGVVKSGETAVVRVTILPGRNNYLSSTRNGVTTTEWGAYPSSYSIERVRDFDVSTAPEKPAGEATPAVVKGGLEVIGPAPREKLSIRDGSDERRAPRNEVPLDGELPK
ncbi:MAG: hypothetical protein IT428_00325 [Planctomycetaceae bacterium]|nr:hypothetical protein [Planctomycetaceae bacterium]